MDRADVIAIAWALVGLGVIAMLLSGFGIGVW
jgi:hypothetical protein